MLVQRVRPHRVIAAGILSAKAHPASCLFQRAGFLAEAVVETVLKTEAVNGLGSSADQVAAGNFLEVGGPVAPVHSALFVEGQHHVPGCDLIHSGSNGHHTCEQEDGGPVNTGVEGASLSLSGAVQNGDSTGQNGAPLSMHPAAVAGRRQLEEIRLSMTLEAAVRLVRKDFNIDAKPLSDIVDFLRQEENNYYEKSIIKN